MRFIGTGVNAEALAFAAAERARHVRETSVGMAASGVTTYGTSGAFCPGVHSSPVLAPRLYERVNVPEHF